MHEYDVALKRILTRPGSSLLFALTGCAELHWLNVELPKVNNLRVDLLGAAPSGELIHFEFQTRNRRDLPLRMGEYAFSIRRRYGKYPRQIVLYVGEAPLRMASGVTEPNLKFRFQLIDVRDLDGAALLASRNLSDNIVALLTRPGERPGALRQVFQRIAGAPEGVRSAAIAEFLILAGLRKVSGRLGKAVEKMPITEDIMKNEVLKAYVERAIKKHVNTVTAKMRAELRAQVRAKALAEARSERRAEALLEVISAQIRKRFGRVTASTRKRLAALTPKELSAAAIRLLDAESVDDLFAS